MMNMNRSTAFRMLAAYLQRFSCSSCESYCIHPPPCKSWILFFSPLPLPLTPGKGMNVNDQLNWTIIKSTKATLIRSGYQSMQDDVGSLNAKQNMIPPNYGRCCKAASASVGLIITLILPVTFSITPRRSLTLGNSIFRMNWSFRDGMYVVVVYWIVGSSMHQGEALLTLILTGHPGRKRWSARDSLHDPLNQTRRRIAQLLGSEISRPCYSSFDG